MERKQVKITNHKEITLLSSIMVVMFSIFTMMNHFEVKLGGVNNYLFYLFYLFGVNIALSIIGVKYLYKNSVGLGFLSWRLLISITYMFYSFFVGYCLARYYFNLAGSFFLFSLGSLVTVTVLVIANLFKLNKNKEKVRKSSKLILTDELVFNLTKSYYGDFDAKIEVNNHTSKKSLFL